MDLKARGMCSFDDGGGGGGELNQVYFIYICDNGGGGGLFGLNHIIIYICDNTLITEQSGHAAS